MASIVTFNGFAQLSAFTAKKTGKDFLRAMLELPQHRAAILQTLVR
jgi:hypothetical protein